MNESVLRFRRAMVRYFDQALSPEIAAAIEAETFGSPPDPQVWATGRFTVRIEQRQEYLDFINAQFGTHHRMGMVRLLAVLRDGELAAVVMYSRLTTRSCEMTIATDGNRDWANRATLRRIFGLPFEEWNLPRVTVVVHESNAASLQVCARLGYVKEGLVREAFADGAGVVMGMLRRECRWIGGA